MRRLKHLIDKTLGTYVLVNSLCWGVGTGVMFLLYNLHIGGYWFASACNYLIGGTMGYFLNRRYTFHSTGKQVQEAVKYVAHMLVCYFIAYTLAPRLCAGLEARFSLHAAGNVSLMVGVVLFAVLNYFGQRYVVFRRPQPAREKEDGGAPRA